MDTQQAIAARIRQFCREQDITPTELSRRAKVPQATVKSILGGERRNPGAATIKKLCDGFDITPGEFFSAPLFDKLLVKTR